MGDVLGEGNEEVLVWHVWVYLLGFFFSSRSDRAVPIHAAEYSYKNFKD